MISSNYSALFAALLALGACGKSDEGSTDTDTAGQTTGATTGGATTGGGATTTATTSAGTGTSDGTTHASHGETVATTADEPTTTATTPATTGDLTTGGDEALSCAAYCDSIGANCSGEHTQYGSNETCLATCAAFMPGSIVDTGGDTLGCRIYHAGAAAGMPEVHCTHAGPGGNGVCGANCDGFCTIAAHACPEAWPDAGACKTACETFPSDESYDATDVAGDTFACRLYHLTAAAVDPATHCPHIKGDSAPCM